MQASSLFIAAALALAGCGTAIAPTSAKLTYESKPEGAELFEGGKSIGTAPVTRTYSGDGKSDSVRTPEVIAVWPSGAKEGFYTFLKLGSDRVATIERPAAAPGLQADLDNAKKIASAREAEQRRKKEEVARDIARQSDRCKRQQAGVGPAAGVDDCS